MNQNRYLPNDTRFDFRLAGAQSMKCMGLDGNEITFPTDLQDLDPNDWSRMAERLRASK